MERSNFIILEAQENVREMLVFAIETNLNFEPFRAKNAWEAIQLISTKGPSLIVCGDGEKLTDAAEVFKYCAESFNMKNMVFLDASSSNRALYFEGKSPHGKLPKGDNIDLMLKRIEKYFEVDEESGSKEYTPISLNTIKNASPFFKGLESDIYVQLNEKKFIKLFNEGDSLRSEDIVKYQEKNVSHFYINRQAKAWIMKNIQLFSDNAAEDSSFTFNIEHDAQAILREFKIHPETIAAVASKIEKAKVVIGRNNNLKSFFKNLKLDKKSEYYIQNRTKLISNISCGLAKELHWGSEASYDKLIHAAHLHDVLLYTSNPVLTMMSTIDQFNKFDEKYHFSEQEKSMFLKHPEAIVQIIKSDARIPEEALTIIEQHHEMPDGSGFPRGIDHRQMRPFSCLFIVSLDLANYILSKNQWDLDRFINTHRKKYKGDNFYKILRALNKFKHLNRSSN